MKRRALALLSSALAAAVLSELAHADCAATSCNDVYIDQLYVESGTNGIWIQTSGTESALNCTPSSGVWLWVPPSSTQLKELYALVLAAHLADRKISVRINEGSNSCTVAYITMIR